MMRSATMSAIATALAVVIAVPPAVANPPLVAKAKAGGYPAQNCQYCHVTKLPKKDDFKTEDLNERGKWLLSEKDKRKAKEVGVDWLKDYPGGKEQK